MTALLLYIARSGLYLGVFYAFYLLVMRRTTFFRFNRMVLLMGTVVCAVLPLLRVRTADALSAAGPLYISGVGEVVTDTPVGTFSWSGVLTYLYLAGIIAVAGYTTVSALLLHRRVSGCSKDRIGGYKTVFLSDDLPSFTFGKTIFIGRKDLEENPAIFLHETIHVSSRHYLDLFFFRAVQIIWWWNPAVWIMREELGLLHEYEADEGVISKGIDATKYQLLLVRKAVGEQRFSLASGFQHAQLKNRIAMMIKPTSNSRMRLSYLALIPLMAILVFSCNPSKRKKAASEADKAGTEAVQEQEAFPFQEIEVKPTFNGEDASEFSNWVNSHLKYPESAIESHTEGRVVLQFTVNTDGSMSDIKVLRGVSPDLDAEALRVLNSCTQKWTPGMQDGKPVPVVYTFPIKFQLR